MKGILALLWRNWRYKWLLVALAVVFSAIGVASPLLTGGLVTELGKGSGCDVNRIVWLLASIALFSLASLALGVWNGRVGAKSSAWMIRDFRAHVWNHVLKLPLVRMYKDSPSVWMQKICGDTALVAGTFRMVFFTALNFLLFLGGTCIVAFAKEPLLIALFVVALLAGVAFHRHFKEKITVAAREQRESSYAFNASTFDLLMLHPLVRMFRLAGHFAPRFRRANDLVTSKQLASENISISYNTCLQLEMSAVHLIVLSGCVYLHLHGRIALGDILAFDMLVGQLVGGVTELLSSLPEVDQGIESAKAVAELLSLETDDWQPGEIHSADCAVSLDSVAFSYDGVRNVLDGASGRIEKGEYVCCCGGNGAGKTTLLNVVLGLLRPQSGTVGVGAVRPAVIPQRVIVFRDTVLENVRLFDSAISESEVLDVLRRCGLSHWLESLRDGLQAPVNCEMLSGGELQRLGIARAIVRKPELLVVDEVSNNLDIVEKTRIRGIIRELKGQCAILAVTHDIDNTAECDKVWVLDRGRITEVKGGSPDEVGRLMKEVLDGRK